MKFDLFRTIVLISSILLGSGAFADLEAKEVLRTSSTCLFMASSFLAISSFAAFILFLVLNFSALMAAIFCGTLFPGRENIFAKNCFAN